MTWSIKPCAARRKLNERIRTAGCTFLGMRFPQTDRRAYTHERNQLIPPCEKHAKGLATGQVREGGNWRYSRPSGASRQKEGVVRPQLEVNSIRRRNTICDRRWHGCALVEDVVE
jgi:hypothetical protein